MKRKIISGLFLFLFFPLCMIAVGKDGVETGKASYYSNKFHNRKTASGVRFDQQALTCAHRTYPFGTKLLVRNPLNDKEVVVEVTDRGPFRKGRIIDLSLAAAKELDIVRQGVATVEVSEYIEYLNEEEEEKEFYIPDLVIEIKQLPIERQPLAFLQD